MTLYKRLKEYSKGSVIPMHMPGGKRKSITGAFPEAFSMDITEIEGFDDLHHSGSLLKEEMKRYAKHYGADETLILVNGSTAGILAAVAGALQRGEKILVAGNVHISVINAVILGGLDPVYIYPEYDGYGICKKIRVEDIKEKLEKDPDIHAVVVTSPTYEGIVSDIGDIAAAVHEKGIPLIVDEAHGAHFPFSDRFPENACRLGADAVINSLHKTLPALTQTGLLHLNGNIINRNNIRTYWNMLQTTSPSYVLMGSISACFDWLGSEQGRKEMEKYAGRVTALRRKIEKELENIRLLDNDDLSKIVLLTDDGKRLSDKLLKRYNIQLEMAAWGYSVAMTSVSDRQEDFDVFFEALKEIDREMSEKICSDVTKGSSSYSGGVRIKKMKPCDAFMINSNGKTSSVPICEAEGAVAAESVFIYPPGTPEIVAGEVYDRKIINTIEEAVKKGYEVAGTQMHIENDKPDIRVSVLKNQD